jgi:hypothetical protein
MFVYMVTVGTLAPERHALPDCATPRYTPRKAAAECEYNAKDDYPSSNKTDSNAAHAFRWIFGLLTVKSTNLNSHPSFTNRPSNNFGNSYTFTHPYLYNHTACLSYRPRSPGTRPPGLDEPSAGIPHLFASLLR